MKKSPSRKIRFTRSDKKTVLQQRTKKIIKKLRILYPSPETELKFKNAFQLLISTILSAQCTDVRVNQVTPKLFSEAPRPRELAAISKTKLEKIIFSTGFYKNKAKNLIGCAKTLEKNYGGKIPRSLNALITLPGVARKTANVVLGNAFGITEGIAVDTHVTRLSHRLALSEGKNPIQIEKDLMAIVDKKDWIKITHWLIFHGRKICSARNAQCEKCVLRPLCPRIGVSAE